MKKESPARLSDPEYWSGVHRPGEVHRPAWKRALRRCLPPRWLEARKRRWEQRQWKREQRGLRAHWLFQLTEVLLKPCLLGKTGLKGLEIGSAPGRISLELWRRLGMVPYGLEYTESGVQAQRTLYRKFGLNEDLVMHGDLFDEVWRKQHAEAFDLVASFGLIEHFSDPEDVVNKHLELLRPGGVLVVTVPNINEQAWYGWLQSRFNPAVHAIHNTCTCTRKGISTLVVPHECEIIHCDTLGGPDITFVPDRRGRSRFVSRIFQLIHPMANQLNHLCMGKRLISFPRTASILALVAVKKPMEEEQSGHSSRKAPAEGQPHGGSISGQPDG